MIRALLVLVLVALAGDALAGKRKVVVLEVRSGAAGASDLGLRLAQILRRTTALEVVDPDDARRSLGKGFDDELARCQGEPPCVAKLGSRLGASEVLLVGVSELGDLIVALQIIETKGGKVRARVNESLPRGDEPDDNQLEGFLRRLLPRGDFRRFGTIRVTTQLDGANVAIGGVERGRTPLSPVVVEAPESYDVKVTKAGYIDFTASIEVPPDAVVEVRPQLGRKGEGDGTPWYGRWWFWAAAGTVATAAVVGAIVVTQDDPSSADVVVAPW